MNGSSGVFRDYRSRVEAALDARLPGESTEPVTLHSAMRYATLNGGKRIRSLLVYATGQTAGADLTSLDAPACAVELIHAYSLVHDDLPSMDDDKLRRGKPTCHIAYDEATAILAGDALQSLAFELLARETSLAPKTKLLMIEKLAWASGSLGMAGGQVMDIEAQGRRLEPVQLKQLHLGKTGALIRASVSMGALCGDTLAPDAMNSLDQYAAHVGLAFQVIDDVLDEESDTQTLGKTSGSDRTLDKATYPSVLGMAESKNLARELETKALGALDTLEKLGVQTHLLREIARIIIHRSY